MARKLRSMFKSVIPQPGSGERPSGPGGNGAIPGGTPAGAVYESQTPIGSAKEVKQEPDRDLVARLAYERWVETGGGEVENWVWAEAELRRRGG